MVHTMYFLCNYEWHKSGNLCDILSDFVNGILKYEGQKFYENFHTTIVIKLVCTFVSAEILRSIHFTFWSSKKIINKPF